MLGRQPAVVSVGIDVAHGLRVSLRPSVWAPRRVRHTDAMKQLTELDGSLLYMETATTFGHVSGLGLYERPDDDFDRYDEVYARWGSFVGELEPMRRRVVEVPLRLDHPYWVMDPNFDLEFHIRHLSLAPPGRADQLASRSRGSSGARWTAAGRCGRSMSSRAWRVGAGGC